MPEAIRPRHSIVPPFMLWRPVNSVKSHINPKALYKSLSFHKTNGTYQSIKRFSGLGDLGLDVVAFTAKEGFAKPWEESPIRWIV